MEKQKKGVTQAESDLQKHLCEQLEFLCYSASQYDIGKIAEAKRMAHTLRILLHDTKKSKSLFSQLRMKNIPWINSAYKYDPDNLVSYVGLISIRFDNPHGRIPWLIPKGLPSGITDKMNFNKWWSTPVIIAKKNSKCYYFSRQKLILDLANKDGGSHVDPELEEDYYELSRNNIIGFSAHIGANEYPLVKPELPCIRQICHETLLSIRNSYSNIIPETYKDQIEIIPYGQSSEIRESNNCAVKISIKINDIN